MNFLSVLYRKLPSGFRQFLDPVAKCYHSLRHLRREVWSVTGEEVHTRLPLSVLFAAQIEERSYVLRLMFGSSFEEHCLGRVWWWQFPGLVKSAARDHAIVIVGVHRFEVMSMVTKGSFVLPNWVSGEVTIPLEPTVLHSRSVKSDFKKIVEHKLTYEVTKDPKQFEEFYRDMHVPYTRVAHGNFARIESCEGLQRKFKDWELLLVKRGSEYIAGQLITYEDSGPRFYLVGIRDGNREYLKQRVLGAVYQFSILHLVEKGFQKASLGFSRAFLNDGVLRYKQKLFQRITGCSAEGLALTVSSYTPATKSFLRNNPFIAHSGDGLCGVVFVDAGTQLSEAEERQINETYFHPGLVRMCTYRFPQNDTSAVEDAVRGTSISSVSEQKDETVVREASSHS